METVIDDIKHKVIYIEYQDGLPFRVVTIFFVGTAKEPYWRPEFWDFFANEGDANDLMAYRSGSGGSDKEIDAPQYVDEYSGASYWMADNIQFDGIPQNIRKLKHPKLLHGYENSRNPFKVAEITNSYEHCDRCGYDSTEFCDEHKFFDEEGTARYIDDNSSAE
jgi:hypothetical protein